MEKTPLLNVSSEGHYVLVIHGGAGTMSKEGSTPAQQAEYKAALSRSLLSVSVSCESIVIFLSGTQGYDVLSHGGEAMDAVVAAVKVMEGDLISTKTRLSIELPSHCRGSDVIQTVHCSTLLMVLFSMLQER